MKIRIYIIGIAFLSASCATESDGFRVTNLRCENLTNPKIIQQDHPRLSWHVESSVRGDMQSAIQILVASSPELLPDAPDLWNSGKVSSNENFLDYGGSELGSATNYYWMVKGWDVNNHPSDWSEVSTFGTGFFKPSDFKAKWIACASTEERAPLLRKEFKVSKEIRKAIAYVSGIGAYSKVKEDRFANRNKKFGPYEKPVAWLQMEIEFADGTGTTLITDASWKSMSSHITYNHFFGGEDVDARLVMEGWAEYGLDDNHWQPVEVTEVAGKLEASMIPPMRLKEVYKPVVSFNPEKGVYTYDIGQNIGGVWRIRVKGKTGTTLKIRGAEKIAGEETKRRLARNDKLSFTDQHGGVGLSFTGDVFSNYTLSGKGTEIYHPLFFYSGFRYLQVDVDHPDDIESLEIEGVAVYSDLEPGGSFECSDEVLNRLHTMTDLTVKGIMQSVPNSNPHSEKYGWTGDIHLFFDAANYSLYMLPLWTNWLKDVSAAQSMLGQGAIPHLVPNYTKYGPTTATWGAVLPIAVLDGYRYYGDKRMVETFYESVKNWCEYLKSTSDNLVVRGIWGDHVQPGVTENGEIVYRGSTKETASLIATAYFFRTAEIVAELAEILDQQEDLKAYLKLAEDIHDRFNTVFYNESKGIYEEGYPEDKAFDVLQAVNFIALDFNLVEEDKREALLDALVENITVEHDTHLMTGITGSKALLRTLTRYGYHDLLYDIIHQRSAPGWGYWVDIEATTLWQTWSSPGGDQMHAMFGSVDEYNFNTILGLGSPNYGKSGIGFRHIFIEPYVTGEVRWAKGHLVTPQGPVGVDWKMGDNSLSVKVEVPVNATATLIVPDNYQGISESGKPVWDNASFQSVEGVSGIQKKEGKVAIELTSGSYSFLMK
jgi:alpha-L-rhamnosidase